MSLKPAVREVGTVKELYGQQSDAEEAKAERDALIETLRSKQVTVAGEYQPNMFGDRGLPEYVKLSGGPAAGAEVAVPRGHQEYRRASLNPEPGGNTFITITYRRTKDRTKDGLPVFEFVAPSA
jgi:hypothetical protein